MSTVVELLQLAAFVLLMMGGTRLATCWSRRNEMHGDFCIHDIITLIVLVYGAGLTLLTIWWHKVLCGAKNLCAACKRMLTKEK